MNYVVMQNILKLECFKSTYFNVSHQTFTMLFYAKILIFPFQIMFRRNKINNAKSNPFISNDNVKRDK